MSTSNNMQAPTSNPFKDAERINDLLSLAELLGIDPDKAKWTQPSYYNESDEPDEVVDEGGGEAAGDGGNETANDGAQGANELPSVEEMLQEAAAHAALSDTLTPQPSENNLYEAGIEQLSELQGLLGTCVPMAGPCGTFGFQNPAVFLRRCVRSSDYDHLSKEGFDTLAESVGRMALLWEGQETMQGMRLACNALVYAVLHNRDLADAAFFAARRLIMDHREVLRCAKLKE